MREGERKGERGDAEGRERDVREGVIKRAWGDEIGNIMLLKNDSRANKIT